ncbi:MAG: hypothetical protein QMD36_04930 [Candidatus Aenigmarchaeota archaeon]|nr:hypothetical protein [Candidatus Aenigmarchaeota archaeon]
MEAEKKRAALFIDGQFMLPFSFEKMNKYLQKYDVAVRRVYVTKGLINHYASEEKDIVGALYSGGFEPILTGHLENVDAYLLVDAMEIMSRRYRYVNHF